MKAWNDFGSPCFSYLQIKQYIGVVVSGPKPLMRQLITDEP